jgi:hypothetical protein
MSDLILDEFRGRTDAELKDVLRAETLTMFAFTGSELCLRQHPKASNDVSKGKKEEGVNNDCHIFGQDSSSSL